MKEVRKVHDLFFDILKLAFPDTNFQEDRSSLSFTGHPAIFTLAAPSRHIVTGQSKQQKHANEVDPEPNPPQKPLSHGPILTREDTRTRSHIAQRETRFGSSSSNRELGQQEDSRLFAHPGDLVLCKRKRKDGEKSKLGNGSASPASPASVGRSVKSPGSGSGSGSGSKETRLSRQISHQQRWVNQPPQQVNAGGTIGWANPVKRMRTDAGKRRPSHL